MQAARDQTITKVEPKRILVVDDEESIRLLLKKALGDAGYVIYTAENGEKALNILQQTQIDLLLTDIMMPGMNGIELIAKAKELNGEVCCIAMTAYVNLESATESMKRGAFDYISKPFDLKQLKTRLIEAYDRQRTLYAELERKTRAKLANMDPLTGLHNPRQFHMYLEQELDKNTTQSSSTTLIMLDIDGLQSINESHGLEIGDAVLKGVAHELQQRFPLPAQICRYGIDEFMVMLPDTRKEETENKLKQLKEILQNFPVAKDRKIPVSITVGVAGSPNDGEKSYILIGAVQRALQQMKKR